MELGAWTAVLAVHFFFIIDGQAFAVLFLLRFLEPRLAQRSALWRHMRTISGIRWAEV